MEDIGMKGNGTRLVACGLMLALLFTLSAAAESIVPNETADSTTDSLLEVQSAEGTFADYYAQHRELSLGTATVQLKTPSFQSEKVTQIDEDETAYRLSEGSFVRWNATVPAGLYRMTVTYRVEQSPEATAACAVALNGAIPFREAESIALSKVWQDGERKIDNRGNEISPTQIEVSHWTTAILNGQDNIEADSYYFAFDGTETTLQLTAITGDIAVRGVQLDSVSCLPTYEAYRERNVTDTVQGYSKQIEAESAQYKSSSSLYPSGVRNTPVVTPNDPIITKLNTIGSGNWKSIGQWISWDIVVPSDGWYTLDFKYRQNGSRGMVVRRRLTVDGVVPFREAECMQFSYKDGWTFAYAGGETPWQVYLTAGSHELRLESVLGELTETLSSMNRSLVSLNTLYRRIIMITGVSPDPYNDYYLHREIPELLNTLQQVSNNLEANAKTLEEITGNAGNLASGLNDIIRQLRSFYEKPLTIPTRLDSFRSNISVLAELVLSLKEQPLELDSFTICSADTVAQRELPGFFKKFWFRFLAFLASFNDGYATIGDSYGDGEESLSVWISANDLLATGVSSGRDQATVLKQFIDEQFTPDTGIHVNLSLVSTSDTLLQAIVGGKAPDVALFVPKTLPITLAMRGGVMDLSQFPQFEEWQERVYDSAFIPYRYNGGIYAMPETQVFQVLYYRTDIFEELNLTPPETWEDFYRVTAILQGENLQVGVSADQTTFEMLLLQRGQSIYNEDVSRVTLTDPEAIDVFRQWTDLYSQYGIDVSYDFFNRFRTGEMPMGIAQLTLFSQFSVAAPEIHGVWDMAAIPGTVSADGSINRAQGCTTTGCVILRDAKNPKDACAFIDWWTSDDVQFRFGNSIENRMGAAARYNTANKNAFAAIPWSGEQRTMLQALWAHVSDIPQSPASYSVSRNIMNAFRRVVYYNETPREVMSKYAEDMNRELIRKRQEFGLE